MDHVNDTEDETSDEPEEVVLADSWPGVTAGTITLGMTLLNFEELKQLNLIPAGWGELDDAEEDNWFNPLRHGTARRVRIISQQ